MNQIINRVQTPGHSSGTATSAPLLARIGVARVSGEAFCSEDVPEKLGIPVPAGDATRVRFERELPVLEFSEEFLRVDGYVAGRLLRSLWERGGGLWFIFGAFRSLNGKRYHIVLPRDQVPRCFAVSRWEILDWTKKEIHRF